MKNIPVVHIVCHYYFKKRSWFCECL